MADALTFWRKTNRLTARCRRLSVGDTHACANHRGDFVDALPVARASTTSDRERTAYALVIITDIPVEVVEKAKRWFRKGTRFGDDDALDRPRILNLDVDLLKAEYPTQANAIDKLFDPERTLTVNQIPSMTWAKFRNAVWDKINVRVVPEAQWETDPDG